VLESMCASGKEYLQATCRAKVRVCACTCVLCCNYSKCTRTDIYVPIGGVRTQLSTAANKPLLPSSSACPQATGRSPGWQIMLMQEQQQQRQQQQQQRQQQQQQQSKAKEEDQRARPHTQASAAPLRPQLPLTRSPPTAPTPDLPPELSEQRRQQLAECLLTHTQVGGLRAPVVRIFRTDAC